jgi:hypothetical protein
LKRRTFARKEDKSMKIKEVRNYFLRGIFTIAYTLVVLPFTLNFFKSIATPSSKETLATIIPLIASHNFMLPIFLGSLEFASISLACAFWMNSQDKNRSLILALLLACQSFSMASIYYDVRSKDYQAEKKVYDDARATVVDSLKGRISGLKDQISTTSNELREIRKDASTNSSSIGQLLSSMQWEWDQSDKKAIQSEIQGRGRLRERRERQVDELVKRKESFENDLKQKEEQFESYIQSPRNKIDHKSELEYIVGKSLTYKSFFAGFIALLFPLSVIGVAFVLPKNSKPDPQEFPSFNLQDHLKNTALFPQDMHYSFVRLLIPSIDAYISAFKASRTIANENDKLHLQNSLFRQIINEVRALQKQIASCDLEENSKGYLLSELNKIMNRQLIGREE